MRPSVSNISKQLAPIFRLGANCDLAEADYQAGLTRQQAGDLHQSQIYCNFRAHRLFTQMAALQQLAKIKARIY